VPAISPLRTTEKLAKPFLSFDQTFSKVCGEEGESPPRAPQSAKYRPGKSNLIFGSATPKNQGGFSAKKLTVYADNNAIV